MFIYCQNCVEYINGIVLDINFKQNFNKSFTNLSFGFVPVGNHNRILIDELGKYLCSGYKYLSFILFKR